MMIFVTRTIPMASMTLAHLKLTAIWIYFKIEYFDKALTYHSADPADPSITERVITIMLAEEY